ncbi:DPOA2 [Enterospora canceri]|uniref:DNA polymerase alpha subunit B n=1 Tax=Enterospora canceri TaxID=1081671 RepID=A0A1Y1S7T2_9MICR|nr:DPOA2 [Enterospora canceri]
MDLLKEKVFKKLNKNKTKAEIRILPRDEVEYFYMDKHDKMNYTRSRLSQMECDFLDVAGINEFVYDFSDRMNESEFITFGCITSATGGTLEKNDIHFQTARDMNTLYKLDLSILPEYSVFNGQMAAIRCKMTEPDTFSVSKLMILPIFEKFEESKGDLDLVVAKGPFSEEFIEKLVDLNTQIVVLLGPLSREFRPFQEFTEMLTEKLRKNMHTRMLLVPSAEDMEFVPTFPQYSMETGSDRVLCLTNPAEVVVNGHLLALNNFDALFDLSTNECCHIPSNPTHGMFKGDRLKRLCFHLIFQHSYAPVMPSQFPICYCSALQMPVCPDLYITSSHYGAFDRPVGPCNVINTGKESSSYYTVFYGSNTYEIRQNRIQFDAEK